MKRQQIIMLTIALCIIGSISAWGYWLNIPNHTDKTCNIDGSASATGVDCQGKNEDGTDATFNNCLDGSGNPFMYVNDIHLTDTTVYKGATTTVTCEVCCYSSNVEYNILYYNKTEWKSIAYGNCDIQGQGQDPCPQDRLRNYSASIQLDKVTGQHTFRCQQQYSDCTASDTCCSETYADNDDINITVIKKKIITETEKATRT